MDEVVGELLGSAHTFPDPGVRDARAPGVVVLAAPTAHKPNRDPLDALESALGVRSASPLPLDRLTPFPSLGATFQTRAHALPTWVGVSIDGLDAAPTSGIALALTEVERIELLRGPQPIATGSLALGSTVRIFTRKPSYERSLETQLQAGTSSSLESRLRADLPLVPERATLRVSLAAQTRDGLVRDALRRERGQDRSLGARIDLRANPTEEVEVLLSLSRVNERRRPSGARCRSAAGAAIAGGDASSDACTSLVAATSRATPLQVREGDRPSALVEHALELPESRLHTREAAATISWQVRPELTLTSISAWREHAADTSVDIETFARAPFRAALDETRRQLVQELVLQGRTLDRRSRYTFGLHAARASSSTQTSALEAYDYALYGQWTYALTRSLDLALGARAESRRVELGNRSSGCSADSAPDALGERCAARVTPGSDSWKTSHSLRHGSLSPTATLTQRISHDVRAYLSYSSAKALGGLIQVPASGALDVLEPTTARTIEGGLETTWLDDRLALDLALFRQTLNGVTLPTLSEPTERSGRTSSGIASSRFDADAWGAELGARAAPWAGLELAARIGLTHVEQRSARDASSGARSTGTEVFTAVAGRREDSTALTFSLATSYARSLGGLGTLRLESAWTQHSRAQLGLDADALDPGAVGLLDARIALELPDARTEIALFGTNLLDRRYDAHALQLGSPSTARITLEGAPRHIGFELRRRF